jgi:hypothetical protein
MVESGAQRGCIEVGNGGFCGRDGVRKGGKWTIIGVGSGRGWCVAVGIGGHGHASGWESTHRGAADGWESAHRGAARSGGFRGVGGRAGRHRQRRLDCHQALCGDSGQPLPRYGPSGDASCQRGVWCGCALPPRRAMAYRVATNARDSSSCGHQGSYGSRGCPESPHVVMCLPPPRWRCRPARPPTRQNPALRAAKENARRGGPGAHFFWGAVIGEISGRAQAQGSG